MLPAKAEGGIPLLLVLATNSAILSEFLLITGYR